VGRKIEEGRDWGVGDGRRGMRDHGIGDCYMQEQGYMTKGSREHSSENSWWGSICMCKRGDGNFLVNKLPRMQNKH
jgi:hypothetical protein